jgi:ABC-2 type transport system permease protein
MIRNILLLAFNDLAIAFRNKTFFLILFIPLFVFLSLDLVDGADAEAGKVKIGLIRHGTYASEMIRGISVAENLVEVSWVKDEKDGIRLLKAHQIDGILISKDDVATFTVQLPSTNPFPPPNPLPEGGRTERLATGSLALLVLKKDSIRTLAIMQSFSALQKAVEGAGPDWISGIQSLHQGGIQRETLPTWVLMLVLLIGFIILPAQVAEEKEKKLLLALLQTPIHEVQWLIAKLILGMVLILTAVLFLHLLGKFGPLHLFDYIVILLAGSFCFSAFGILLGFLCRNQASARTLGVIFYLPHLLPSAMADVSEKLTAVAPLLPSYQLYQPLQSILLEEGRLAEMTFDWVYLSMLGLLMVYFAYRLMKRRWLM